MTARVAERGVATTAPERFAPGRRRRDEARARVEDIALDLFLRHGFDQVTVERIAAAARIGPATFYRWFGTKDGVLFGYQERWLQEVCDTVDAVDVRRPRAEQVRCLLHALAAAFDRELGPMQVRDEILARNPTLLPRTLAVQRVWERELATGLARRRGIDGVADFTADTDAAFVQTVIRLAFRRLRAGACPGMSAAVAATLHEVSALTAPASL